MKRCPECGSKRVWCDGVRQTAIEPVQRYLCRLCGFRFSQSTAHSGIKGDILRQFSEQSDSGKNLLQSNIFQSDFSTKPALENPSFKRSEHVASHISSKQTITAKTLNTFADYNRERLVCVSESEAKNLATVETPKEKAQRGATQADVKGKIFQVAWNLQREGYSPSAQRNYPLYLNLLARHGANLDDPESVKDAIARQKNWGASTKCMAIATYGYYAKLNSIHWEAPRYKAERKLPFIPLEAELDALISAAGRKTATILQTLKETGMRIGEACRLKWIDLDQEHDTITVNQPEKGGLPRMFKISPKLKAMLNTLPKKSDNIFGHTNQREATDYLANLRKRVASKLQNPRLLAIHLHTFRHWKATVEYHKTKDILHVMKLLGHRRIETTLLYTQLVQFEDEDEFHSAVANNVEEAGKLVEAGFEYVCSHEGHMLFRKRK